MSKRARSPTNTDSDVNELSEASDGSYREAPKRRSKKIRRARRQVVSKQPRANPKTSAAGSAHDHRQSSSTRAPHPTSWHVVTAVKPARESLLEWYERIREDRGMPWRKPFDGSLDKDSRAQRAYEVWVSEVMLQQTQVATVIPYYNNWMSKFPTINDLAASDIDTVNSLWKGLGYYSRAARILSGAQKVVKELDGRLPDNVKDMQAKIPGIGRYSAGAICSIAYNQCVPVVDGNIIRLLARFLALYAPPKGKQAQDILWAAAEAFVDGSSRPSDINQALIELGSTVCKVRDPACRDCPLRLWCRAYQSTEPDPSSATQEADIEELCTICEPLPADGPITIYPMKIERKKAREELDSVNVIEWRTADDGERFFLLVRRPEGGRYLSPFLEAAHARLSRAGAHAYISRNADPRSYMLILGLLAGLDEFPTVPNISGAAATTANVADIPNGLVNDLLVKPPSRLNSDSSKPLGRATSGRGDESSKGTMRIMHVKPAGEVIHVFSHIRKTYRVQWVLLQGGGDDPPRPRPRASMNAKGEGKGKGKGKVVHKSKSGKRPEVSEDSEAEKGSVAEVARWVPMDQVEHANTGTGVMKVWKLVRTLW